MPIFIGEKDYEHGSSDKTGILLTNLGTPDEPTAKAVKTYLQEFLSDPRVIEIPRLLWQIILRGVILQIRPKRSAKIYSTVWTKEGSPLLVIAQKQLHLVRKELKSLYPNSIVELAMRYGNPSIENALQKLQKQQVRRLLVLPLYPQYSAATSGSSIKEWKDICKKNNINIKTSTICCYPTDDNFVLAHKEEIIKKINNLKNFKLIFSAHGLPEKNIKKGDPYQWQVEQSVNKIIKLLNIKDLDWILSYQSRVGPLKWIGPSTEDIIVENSKLGKHIVLVPIAFVSEHSETLVELDIEYKEIADKNGCKNYTRVPALGTNENYIKAMTNLIIKKQDYNFNGELFPPKIQCPNQFIKCPCLNHE